MDLFLFKLNHANWIAFFPRPGIFLNFILFYFWGLLSFSSLVQSIIIEAFRYINCRESLHSFSTTFVAFSAAVHGVATGFTFLLSMDELYVFLQVILLFLLS